MILPLMAYALGVGFALAAMGAMLERVMAHRRRPRRWIWAAVLAATVLLTIAVPWRGPLPFPAASTSNWIASTTARVLATGADRGRSSAEPRWLDGLRSEVDEVRAASARLDSVAGWGWAMGSVSVVVMYAAALLTLSRRRRSWRETHFRGMRILVASQDGPAVVGVWKPRIVVPEWTLALQPPAVDLMLEHEREHQRARDPLLLHVAALGAMVMPWNPAAWWMLSRLKLAVEMDCDARVLGQETATAAIGSRDAVAYSELLLTVGIHRSPTHSFVAPAMLEHSSTLRRRIVAMYPIHRGFAGVRIATACGTALALLAVALLVPAPSLRAQSTNIAMALPRLRAQAGQATTPAAPPAGSTQVYEIGNGVSAPVPIRQQDPTYTHAAMQAKVQGEVQLSGVVETNGLLDQIRVTKSLDTVHDLDQAAIDAAKKWLFKPAMKDGKPVPVHVQLVLEFRLSAGPRSTQAPEDDFGKGAYIASTAGLVLPSPVQQIDPKYTTEAMHEKIQGTVTIEIVVAPDGTVARARIVQSLDQTYGLDASALAAAKQWTFNPGTLNGQPVPVLTELAMEFRLH